MTLTVLRAGLDTLKVSLRGQFKQEALDRLDSAKQLAVALDSPQPFALGLVEVAMMPSAYGFWSWRLVEPRFTVVGRRNAAAGGAVAQVNFSSFGLSNEDPALLWLVIRTLLTELGNFEQLAVSRADVCVDFQGWAPTPAEMKNVVTNVTYRGTHGTEKQTQTYQFGKKTLLRVYDKSAEIAVSGKTWLPELWGFNNAYDKDAGVWRVEFQAAGEVFKQLGVTHVEKLIEDPGALLDYGLRKFAQLRVPSSDETKTRWPEDPRWTQLREAVFDGIPLQRRIKPSELMTLDQARSRLIGLVALAGAYFETNDYIEALQQLSFATEVHMVSEKVDFKKLVAEKRARVLSGQL